MNTRLVIYILVNKRNGTKIFLKDIFMLKPKQLFIIIYLNVCVNRHYNILFPNGNIPESQFSVPMIEFAMIELDI
jgi:hypothetical protein